MAEVESQRRLLRFGDFEVDLRAGELRKAGVKLKFGGQPFQVLSILLEHPGEPSPAISCGGCGMAHFRRLRERFFSYSRQPPVPQAGGFDRDAARHRNDGTQRVLPHRARRKDRIGVGNARGSATLECDTL